MWQGINHVPGWLRILGVSADYNENEIERLEEIDEEAIAVEKECQEYYYRVELPQVRREIEEFKKEYGRGWVKERRLEYLERRLKELDHQIEQNYRAFWESLKRDFPFWLRQAILEIKKTPELERERKQIEREIYLLKFQPEIKKRRVSQFEIERALNFPFDNLIQVNRRKMAICPFHSERNPSFWIKNNWGYCFGCRWHGSTIKFLMERDKLTFVEAVKSLQ